ncbi:MAG TPA: hypothetical protein VGF75_03800 [Candidatus Saccharimonadales bacterium]|jgi:D-alanine-D-alanine ligase
MSEESCEAAFKVLAKHYTSVKVTNVDNVLNLEELVARSPDLVFLGMEYIREDSGSTPGSKIWLTSYFEEHGILYTGSDQSAHLLQRNKPLAKQRVISKRLNTSPFFVVQSGKLPERGDISLTYPLFVKPTDRGGGLGIDGDSIAYNFEQLSSKIRSISARFQSDSIIEEFLPGQEFSVAVLKDDKTDDYLALPIELIAPIDKNGMRILSSKVKVSNTEQAVGVEDVELSIKVKQLALDVFKALGARDYGRIDIRVDRNGVMNFLEANLLPSLICDYGSFPKACKLNLNLSHEEMILQITRLGFSHQNDAQNLPVLALATEAIL